MTFATVACVALLAGYRPHGYPDGFNSTSELVVFGNNLVGTPADEVFPMWAILAMALLIFVQAFFGALLSPFQRLGVFFHTSFKMVAHDISIFLALFMMFLFNYGFAMYICYPRVGYFGPPYAPHFNYFLGAVQEMAELAITGDAIRLFLDVQQPDTTAMWIEVILFMVLYIIYTMLTLILLLNLLIAMMGTTFSDVQQEAIREWRVLYARNILRLEMMAEVFARPPFEIWNTRGGEELNGRYYVFSRTEEELDPHAKNTSTEFFDQLSLDDEAELIDDVADLRETSAVNIQKLFRGRKGRRRVTSLGRGAPGGRQGSRYRTFGGVISNNKDQQAAIAASQGRGRSGSQSNRQSPSADLTA